MFDKNDFKEKFRSWTELNPNASYEEAKLLCDLLIPIDAKERYSWLEEQSLVKGRTLSCKQFQRPILCITLSVVSIGIFLSYFVCFVQWSMLRLIKAFC